MATVYVARMSGAAGFARTVAIKRLHPHLAADPAFSAMFVDEARLAARIRHPNVIDTLDVVADSGELFLVMDFVLGETLARLIRQTEKRGIHLPAPVVSSIVVGALEGLHAAHEATNERGEPLGIVHRDISPQNILVARDGVARVLDFGVAKAAGRVQETEGGEIKGKLAYMSPEQLTRKPVDRRCDIFAMGIVLWEALTSKRLFGGEDAASTLYAVMHEPCTPACAVVHGIRRSVDCVVW
jgi:serine/threonine-protein kinase